MMKHRLYLWTLLAVLLLAGGIWWTTGFDFVPLPTGPVVIDLEFVQSDWNHRYTPLSLDQRGRAEMPFANAAGKLVFEVNNGKLRVDTNGDGVIDDHDAPAVDLNRPANCATIKVVAIVGGRPVQYPLGVALDEKQEEHGALRVVAKGQLQGSFVGRLIRIADDNNNGRFGEAEDSLAVSSARTEEYDAFRSALEWNHTLALGRHLFSMELLGNGRQLKLTPYTGPLAKVTVQMAGAVPEVQLRLCHVDRVQAGWASSDQTAWFVPGKYRIALVRGLDIPRVWQAAMGADAEPLELKPGPNVLQLGAPFKLDFAAARDGDRIEFTDVRVFGRARERYLFVVPRSAHDEFATAFVRASGKEQRLADLGFS